MRKSEGVTGSWRRRTQRQRSSAPPADDTSTQEKAGRTREEKKNDESKQKRIVLVFSLSFIPIDSDLHPNRIAEAEEREKYKPEKEIL